MSDYFDRVERQIVRNVEAGLPRSSFLPLALRYAASAAAVAVVLVVVAVFLIAGGSGSKPTTAPAAGQGLTVVLTASAIDPGTPLGPALDRAVTILHERLGSVFPGVGVSRAGNEIVVTTPNRNAGARARILALVGTTAPLAFYDWEANALMPEWEDGREPAPDPGSDRDRDQSGVGRNRSPGSAGRGEHGPLRRGEARRQAAGALKPRQLAARPPVLDVRGAGERRVPGGGQG